MLKRADIAQGRDLSGRVALVTGAAGSIGTEIVAHLAQAGARVAAADMSQDALGVLTARIEKWGGSCSTFQFDQGDERSIAIMVEAVHDLTGRIDILVNNAAIKDMAPLENAPTELWDRVMRVNLRGPFLCLRESLPYIRRAGRAGRIINIGSLGERLPLIRGLGAYNSAKAGLGGFTRQAAYEFSQYGITVNAVLPGVIRSPVGRTAGPLPLTHREVHRATKTLFGGIGDPRDVANAVVFFALPASSHITGQSLVVDGGSSIE